MADNNKVTIDAAWFAELYRKANEAKCDCKSCKEFYSVDEFDRLRKERDELKAKLSNAEDDGYRRGMQAARDRLAAAEQCIRDIDIYLRDGDYTREETLMKIGDVISAYIKAKEAK